MFSRLATFATFATLALLAAATPTSIGAGSSGGVIPGGETTACCASTESSQSAAGAAILKSIGVVVQDVNALVGLDCSPISVVGVGSGSACSGTTVSCSNGIFGSIGVGCVPVTAV
ncbi:hydrophobin family protein [Phanerochaete sordida]|uniref:Hydrophobin n=1 Tax=Phanerochaete sordida TaxID=48140 RepID=A0A9P3LB23_9APHY|nr:hydrophobin family protein [Phanerochaete sordida]